MLLVSDEKKKDIKLYSIMNRALLRLKYKEY